MQELLEMADRAMYEAKSKGPNSFIMVKYIPGSVRREAGITKEIGRALENKEFILHYQPIIDLHTNRLAGAEALIRWNHPTRGILYPAEFMACVEKTPLAAELGEWIVQQACRVRSLWNRHCSADGNMGMHINISQSQFMGGQVFECLRSILQDARLPPSCIYLDCLKESFFKDRRQADVASDFCHDLGINLVLDDLKINLFNLNFFFDFQCVPFRLVKVNGNVVESVVQENRTMLQSIRTFTNILAGMGIKMAVKGIENQKQYQAVSKLKCHLGQGYYFSPPLSEEEFENTWFTNNGPKG
jgi:EAL domain-containing protein (putative c-di-GMP-specific phosphodiesterase class I)